MDKYDCGSKKYRRCEQLAREIGWRAAYEEVYGPLPDGRSIAQRLRDAGMGWEEIAKVVGVSRMTLNRWHNEPKDSERYRRRLEYNRRWSKNKREGQP